MLLSSIISDSRQIVIGFSNDVIGLPWESKTEISTTTDIGWTGNGPVISSTTKVPPGSTFTFDTEPIGFPSELSIITFTGAFGVFVGSWNISLKHELQLWEDEKLITDVVEGFEVVDSAIGGWITNTLDLLGVSDTEIFGNPIYM